MKKWSIVLAALFATSLFVHVVTAADNEGDKPKRARKGRGEGAAGRPKRPEGAEGRPQRGGMRPGMGGMMLMRAIDADGDGELSAKEIEGAVEAIKKLDKNNDGKIGKDEMAPPKRKGEGGKGAEGKRPKRGGGEGGKGGRKRPKAEGDK
jgi:hypothetical protein